MLESAHPHIIGDVKTAREAAKLAFHWLAVVSDSPNTSYSSGVLCEDGRIRRHSH